MKIFGKWDVKGIEVRDPGLVRYITLKPCMVPKSRGRLRKPFHKSQMHIVERLLTHLFVPGHKGKKHYLSSGHCTGKYTTAYNILKETFEIIEKKTKKNPVEVLVRAVENAALREEIASYQLGGIIVRKAVVTSPQRRVDIALRLMVQGSYQKSRGTKKSFSSCLADEIIAASNNDPQGSYAIREKERIEREAAGAR